MLLQKRSRDLIIKMLKQNIPGLKALYLFGSQCDGTATRKSDVDIAYLSESELSAKERWDIAQGIAEVLMQDVDLVDLRKSDTIFRYQILSTGERIYGGGYEVDSFETLAYSFYLRFKEERRAIVDEIVKSGTVLGNRDG